MKSASLRHGAQQVGLSLIGSLSLSFATCASAALPAVTFSPDCIGIRAPVVSPGAGYSLRYSARFVADDEPESGLRRLGIYSAEFGGGVLGSSVPILLTLVVREVAPRMGAWRFLATPLFALAGTPLGTLSGYSAWLISERFLEGRSWTPAIAGGFVGSLLALPLNPWWTGVIKKRTLLSVFGYLALPALGAVIGLNVGPRDWD